jgi:hypothetical protein
VSARGDGAYAVRGFEEFWPHYVRMHTRRATHVMHATATSSAALLLACGIATRSPLCIVLAPLADYVISQVSHRVFEKNRTVPWKNTVWHARAELRMFRLTLTGRMAREVRTHLAVPSARVAAGGHGDGRCDPASVASS